MSDGVATGGLAGAGVGGTDGLATDGLGLWEPWKESSSVFYVEGVEKMRRVCVGLRESLEALAGAVEVSEELVGKGNFWREKREFLGQLWDASKVVLGVAFDVLCVVLGWWRAPSGRFFSWT